MNTDKNKQPICRDKNVWSIFERTKCGPKGGGQEARNNQRKGREKS